MKKLHSWARESDFKYKVQSTKYKVQIQKSKVKGFAKGYGEASKLGNERSGKGQKSRYN